MLDEAAVEALVVLARGRSPGWLRQLALRFIEQVANTIDALGAAQSEGRLQLAAEHAHCVKSSSRLMGAQRLGDLFEAVETSARDRDASGMGDKIAALAAELERVRQALLARI